MDKVVDIFLQLVQIPSESGKEEELSAYISANLKKIGYKIRRDKKGNLHIVTRGMRQDGPTLLFNAHLDTVPPVNKFKPQIKKTRITSDGSSVLGADDKSGIAAIMDLLHRIKKEKVLYKEIKVIFTVEEEIGLLGSKALSKKDVSADFAYVLDSDKGPGTVINKAPYQDSFDITIKGRSAHAGLCPEKGVNAIKIAADAISKIKTGQLDPDTTLNFGRIEGGQARNIVPDQTTVTAEIRSHKLVKLKKQGQILEAAFRGAAIKHGGLVNIEISREYNGAHIAEDQDVIKVARKAAQNQKIPFKINSSQGGSDALVINELGVPTVALATGMENVHSPKESIKIKDLSRLSDFLLEIVKVSNNGFLKS